MHPRNFNENALGRLQKKKKDVLPCRTNRQKGEQTNVQIVAHGEKMKSMPLRLPK
jgi:hypothetical protein